LKNDKGFWFKEPRFLNTSRRKYTKSIDPMSRKIVSEVRIWVEAMKRLEGQDILDP
jgi:hypothetical protein